MHLNLYGLLPTDYFPHCFQMMYAYYLIVNKLYFSHPCVKTSGVPRNDELGGAMILEKKLILRSYTVLNHVKKTRRGGGA